ncbi:MAG: hypothetical protein SF123_17395 [Chloroflexota bacterium]|nr:hypothetical protein [Chloroflexota bacterium]
MSDKYRLYTCDPTLEVAGSTTLSFVNNIATPNIADLVAQHGLDAIDTSRWYPVRQVFALFNDIVQRENGNTQLFVAMGMRIAEQSEFPEEMKSTLTLAGILEGWQAHYTANHRNGTFPPVETIKVDDHHYQLVLDKDHIYPFDLVYGMVWGFCRLLLPTGTKFNIKYDDVHAPFRNYGDRVIIDVGWN